MNKDGMHYTLDLAAIEAGYKAGVKIHFICNPQNPTGTVHTRDELSAIADLAKKYGVYVFSDEIHGPWSLPTQIHPFLSISDARVRSESVSPQLVRPGILQDSSVHLSSLNLNG